MNDDKENRIIIFIIVFMVCFTVYLIAKMATQQEIILEKLKHPEYNQK